MTSQRSTRAREREQERERRADIRLVLGHALDSGEVDGCEQAHRHSDDRQDETHRFPPCRVQVSNEAIAGGGKREEEVVGAGGRSLGVTIGGTSFAGFRRKKKNSKERGNCRHNKWTRFTESSVDLKLSSRQRSQGRGNCQLCRRPRAM